MRIIKPTRVKEYAEKFPDAAAGLTRWRALTGGATWTCLIDVRKTFQTADEAKVASGRTVVIFNIKKNDYRLITAIHYNMAKVFVLAFMTHAEYSKNAWKGRL